MWGLQFCVWFHGARGSAARCDTHAPAGSALAHCKVLGREVLGKASVPVLWGGQQGKELPPVTWQGPLLSMGKGVFCLLGKVCAHTSSTSAPTV